MLEHAGNTAARAAAERQAAATATSDGAPTASVENLAAVVAENHADWGEKVADIESLVASVAANDLVVAPGCDDPFADTCIDQRFAADGAIEDLSGKLDAWAVYS